jgi:hypothetical protein
MNTSEWGKPFWRALFFAAAGYDLNETPRPLKDKQYENFFRSIGDVLPCRYCRLSYKEFFEALGFKRYTQLPSCGIVRFVYDMKNMVNNKLWTQEEKALRNEYDQLRLQTSPEAPEFWKSMREKAQKICYTKSPPAFENLVKELYQHRATCSAHMKTCRKAAEVVGAPLPVDIPDPNVTGMMDRDAYSGGKRRRKKTTARRKTSRRRSGKKRRTRFASRNYR